MNMNEATTSERIIDCALELFKQKGFDNVTVNDICNAANITKGTFYYHFKSKDDLLGKFYTKVRIIRLKKLLLHSTWEY